MKALALIYTAGKGHISLPCGESCGCWWVPASGPRRTSRRLESRFSISDVGVARFRVLGFQMWEFQGLGFRVLGFQGTQDSIHLVFVVYSLYPKP